ncbi:hypothetical protein N7517_004711 [Penicillium concentricum]|uniref:Transcription factor domain-containing protein n=1 Tax=Penicillium concentricum TaxID=293559 RepID=A0A9W9S7B7_9EURO|nr:uncharacterized protein N7517_004711 [Penicillium concentricum]KAJ5372705.1 hypothetical protein N7517_004711 [Penicillium concentricum]
MDCTFPHEASQASGSQENYATRHADGPTPPGQDSSAFAQPTSFEIDACVDILGDLPFDIDFDLDLNPVDLNFNGEGLDFAQLPALDHSFSLPSGDSSNLMNLPDSLPSSNFLQPQENPHLRENDRRPNASIPLETPSLGADEQHLIQHYLGTMTGYAKVDDYPRGANNLYTTAFSQSLSFKPLLYAILAFSASHLALGNNSYLETASQYEQLAHDSFEACKDHVSEPGSLLSALFVRAKRVHLLAGDIESFHCLITEASQIALSERGQRALEDPFSLAQRMVIRLALLDARASCYRLGGGKLIRSLRQIPAMSFIFDHDSTAGSASNALVSLLRANILRMKVGELDMRLRFQMESEDVITSPVRTEEVRSLHRHIEHEIRQWEHQMRSRGHNPDEVLPMESVLEASTYAQYLVMAALHGAVLYLYLLYVSTVSWFCFQACAEKSADLD